MRKNVVSIFGYSLVQVQTGSMSPEYPPDSILLVKKTPADELKSGDVITFYASDGQIKGMLNTHRIVSVRDNNGTLMFTTKGDANSVNDSYETSQNDVLGVVVTRLTAFEGIIRFVRKPISLLLFLVIPAVGIIACEIYKTIVLSRKIKINDRLEKLGLDPEDEKVMSLVNKFGIEIFEKAEENRSDKCDR